MAPALWQQQPEHTVNMFLITALERSNDYRFTEIDAGRSLRLMSKFTDLPCGYLLPFFQVPDIHAAIH